MSRKLKLLVMGYSGHGKDETCKIIRRLYGLTSISSSRFANQTIVYPALKDQYHYQTAEACYQDRHRHRQAWYELIKQYNTPNGARLATALFEIYDVYNGLRDIDEFDAIARHQLFHLSLWIDASKRVSEESIDSCTVYPSVADVIIDNNSTLEALEVQIKTVLSGPLIRY